MKNVSIRIKLFMPFFIIFIFFIAVMGIQVNTVNKNAAQIAETEDVSFTTIMLASELKLNIVQVQQWLTDISATQALDGLDDGFELAEEHAELVRGITGQLIALNPASEGELRDLLAHFEVYYETGIQMAQDYISGGPAAGNVTMLVFDQAADEINEDIETFIASAGQSVEVAINEIEATNSQMIYMTVIAVAILVALSLVITYGMNRQIVRPIHSLLHRIEELSNNSGDLTERIIVESKDEVGQLAAATNKFLANVQSIVANVIRTADETTAASRFLATNAEETEQISENIATAMNNVANGAADEARSANNILEMMESAVIDVESGQRETTATLENAKVATETAYESERTMNEAIGHLKDVTDSVGNSTVSIQRLGERSAEITAIITAIAAIADQTNLLSLNAAIEAARAGESGRGFAVVADEVRQLAEQSSDSSNQITELITNIQAEIEAVVSLMENNRSALDKQVQIIEKGGASLKQIAGQVEETEVGTENIYQIFNGLNTKTTNVLTEIEKISKIIEHTAADSEEVAASSDEQTEIMKDIVKNSNEIARMSDELQQQVNQFTV